MMHNPYAPPQAGPQGPQGPHGPQRGTPLPFEPVEVIEAAWRTYRANWGPFTAAFFVVLMASAVPGQIPNILMQSGAIEPGSATQIIVTLVFLVVGWIIQQFFAAGLVRLAVDTTRTGRADFGRIFGEGPRFLSFLGTSFLSGLLVVLGLLVFIVPGVILGLGLILAPYFVIDQGLSPVAAMRASWEATLGHKSRLFALQLLGGLLLIAGVLACCVGYFVAASVVTLALAIVYLRLSGTGGGEIMQAPPPAWGPPPGPPPGPPYGPGPANYG